MLYEMTGCASHASVLNFHEFESIHFSLVYGI